MRKLADFLEKVLSLQTAFHNMEHFHFFNHEITGIIICMIIDFTALVSINLTVYLISKSKTLMLIINAFLALGYSIAKNVENGNFILNGCLYICVEILLIIILWLMHKKSA